MRHLLLFRHAKTERVRAGQQDRDRELTQRGRRDAAVMAEVIAARPERPALVLCSPSVRTRQTLDLALPAFADEPEVRFPEALYGGGDYLGVLRAEGGTAASILVVGHNPAMQATAVLLAADLAGKEAAALADDFPTAALAVLAFDGEWATLRRQSMRVTAFIRPKEL
jgi:phosphohistidine phosphatase